MFWDDIKLVTEQISRYGLRGTLVDIGGMEQPFIADYDLAITTGDQDACSISLGQRPFDHIDPQYMILNPDKGDPAIEYLPYVFEDRISTAVCLNVIEHVKNPFKVFEALFKVMRDNSLLIIETVFAYPYHPSPDDFWRYTPDCLRYLSNCAGFKVLECDWRLYVPASLGIIYPGTNEAHEIRSVYVTLTKGDFVAMPQKAYALPQRFSNNAAANRLLGRG